ncbi:uncharacterized protein LOC129238990 [Anastrepha obliqua]|uniref:uncharacterized protein LOC129238990 n=1 Tax=Anastrepha obliqua TaxID=95512 RepID=UPI002409749C|nr:uncharacterized protein LOC129238990 [Anastrepha obliqua]XP_054730222.1 uncharacterized protein LOC129238990 [Anastrepha obliqua]
MQHHKNLMLQESERMPSHTVPTYRHHHLNIRSLDMNCMDIAKVVRSLKIQAEVSLQTLKDNVHNYTLPRFNTTPENATEYWIKSKLNLSHPYQKFLDRDFTKSVVSHDFSHLEGKTLDEELLKVELNKIYKTIKTLQIIFTRLSEENQKNEQALMHRYRQGFNDMNKYLDVTRVELNNNLQITKSAIDTLQITMENFDENSVTYNETVFAKDWLMVVENISFLQYLDQLYALLLKMCNGTK